MEYKHNIIINKEFWDKIKNKESNKIHNYIYNLETQLSLVLG